MKKYLNISIPAIFTIWLIAAYLVNYYCAMTEALDYDSARTCIVPAWNMSTFACFVVLAYALPACAYAGWVIWTQSVASRAYKILLSVVGFIFIGCSSYLLTDCYSIERRRDWDFFIAIGYAPLLLASITMLWRAIAEGGGSRLLLWQILMSLAVICVCQLPLVCLLFVLLIVVVYMANLPGNRWWFIVAIIIGSIVKGAYTLDMDDWVFGIGFGVVIFCVFSFFALFVGALFTLARRRAKLSKTTLFKSGYILGMFIFPWVFAGVMKLNDVISHSSNSWAPAEEVIVEEVVDEECYDDSIYAVVDSIF